MVKKVLEKALTGVETSNYELEVHTKSEQVWYLLVNPTTRPDAQNNIVGVVGVAKDAKEAVYRGRAVTAIADELRQLINTANA